jgi:uncharacterized protein (TIGR03066 family)
MAHTFSICSACLGLVWLAGLGLPSQCKADNPSHKDGEAKEETAAQKIVGRWQMVKSGGKEIPKEHTIVFTFNRAGQVRARSCFTYDARMQKGTYQVEGNELTIHLEKEKVQTITIKTVDDKKLVTVDPRGQETAFKRLK